MHAGSGKRRVLFVDDEAWSRDLIRHQLTSDRFDVTTAASAREVIDLVRNHPFDVVLSDVMMPGMDGIEMVSELRQVGFDGAIIMVTARSESPNVVAALTAGADDYLTKPVDSAVLSARIDAQLRARRRGDAMHEDFVEGEVIAGKYALREYIGSGTYGTVFLAEHLRLGIAVALKVLNMERVRDARAMADLMRESALAVRVMHPNIVRVFDADISPGGRPFSVSEYAAGPNLRARLLEGPLAGRELAALVVALSGALTTMHRAGVIHRDIKPGNIFMVDDGDHVDFRVGDFGLAVLTSDSATIRATAGHGTIAYMAPERQRGAAYGPPSDVYSAGVVLYEALTGRRRWHGDAGGANGRPGVRREVYRGTLNLIESMLAEDPDERPPAAALASRWIALTSNRRPT